MILASGRITECVPSDLSILVLFGVGMKTKKPVKSTFYRLLMCLSRNLADRTGLELSAKPRLSRDRDLGLAGAAFSLVLDG